jgi:hypothetical protein
MIPDRRLADNLKIEGLVLWFAHLQGKRRMTMIGRMVSPRAANILKPDERIA